MVIGKHDLSREISRKFDYFLQGCKRNARSAGAFVRSVLDDKKLPAEDSNNQLDAAGVGQEDPAPGSPIPTAAAAELDCFKIPACAPTLSELKELAKLKREQVRDESVHKGAQHAGGSKLEEDWIFYVHHNGLRAYAVVPCLDLMAENLGLIIAIYKSLMVTDEFFNETIMPHLFSLALHTGPLPASRCNHDVEAGGLFKHTLLTALEGLTLCNSMRYPTALRLGMRMKVLYQCLAHDLGKLLTDVEIYGRGKLRFDPLSESIMDFIVRSRSEIIELKFIDVRHGKHDDPNNAAIKALQQKVFRDWQDVGADTEAFREQALKKFRRKTPDIEAANIMSSADKSAVQAVRGNGHHMYLPEFIAAILEERLASLLFNVMDWENGIFDTTEGLILSSKSAVLYELGRAYEQLYDTCTEVMAGKDPTMNLKVQMAHYNCIQITGPYKRMHWYKLFFRQDTAYVYGVSLQFSERRRSKSPRISAVVADNEGEAIKQCLPQDVSIINLKNVLCAVGLDLTQINAEMYGTLREIQNKSQYFELDLSQFTRCPSAVRSAQSAVRTA